MPETHPLDKSGPGLSGIGIKAEAPGELSPADRRARDRRDRIMLREFARTRDPRLREQLIERFTPLARSLAWRYAASNEPIEDLIQVANEGLIKAIDRYEPERANAFSSYATPVILGGLRHYFRDATQRVHIPRGLQERMLKVGAELENLDGDATAAEIASRTDMSEPEAQEAMAALATRRPMSIDGHAATDEEDSGSSIGEMIGSEDPGYDRVESSLAAAEVELDDKEREALRLRFGSSLNQREIGEQIGTSQMQVSRLLRRSLGKMLDAVQADPRPNSSSGA